jgi:hypothetical protein
MLTIPQPARQLPFNRCRLRAHERYEPRNEAEVNLTASSPPHDFLAPWKLSEAPELP